MDLIETLAQSIKARTQSGSEPYVLLLGAGASLSSGTALARKVIEATIGSYDPVKWDRHLELCSEEDRFALLRGMVEGIAPSPGYIAMAQLVSAGFFDIILSTNYDPLVEDSLAAANMRRRDYLLLVNDIMSPETIARQIDSRVPRVKIVKLHGDLFYRRIMFTSEEMKKYPAALRSALNIPLNRRDVIVVGHGLADANLCECFGDSTSAVWRVDPFPPGDSAKAILKKRKSLERWITGSDGSFDAFFTRLRNILLPGGEAASKDRLANATVRLRTPGTDADGGLGFVISPSGHLISESTVARALCPNLVRGDPIEFRLFNGGPPQRARLVAPPRDIFDLAVFAPMDPLFDASAVGLKIASSPAVAGETFSTLVCDLSFDGWGTRAAAIAKSKPPKLGLVTGKVTRINVRDTIQGWDKPVEFTGMVETDVRLLPGTCGSPMVRSDGSVIGVLFAGNETIESSLAIPASRLLALLRDDAADTSPEMTGEVKPLAKKSKAKTNGKSKKSPKTT